MSPIRDSQVIWDAWSSGAFVGPNKPCTRVTVEKNYYLRPTDGTVLGQWRKGPARWWQRDSVDEQLETELTSIISVSTSMDIDQDAGSADIAMINVTAQGYGAAEAKPGQYGDLGYYTFDHGGSQEAKARWNHASNPWKNVIVPNALLRVYQGFGGHDKSLRMAVTDGNLVLNGVFLVDDVTISTDGLIHLKCRDMGKLLVDQQIFPPLIPRSLYPLKYCRYTYQIYKIPPDPPPGTTHEIITQPTSYGTCGTPPYSSTDDFYGENDTHQTGHPPSDPFDWSFDAPPNPQPGQIAHQRTYWLSEPKGAATDDVWIEFCCDATDVNLIYYHPWGGNYRVMVSVFENGGWVGGEGGGQGGVTPENIPYVSTFTTNWEGGQPPGVDPNKYYLPRDYKAERIRLTITNLVEAQEGGFRAGARKIVALWDKTATQYPALSFACASMPYNTDNTTGYWQVRSNGRVYAFGDARTQPAHDPLHTYPVIGMTAHPSGTGYWTIDYSGHVVSYGSAANYGDISYIGQLNAVDIAPTASGNGYWILRRDGVVQGFGDASDLGDAVVSGLMPSGSDVIARSIESTPGNGYWVLLTDGTVQAFGDAVHYGDANRSGFELTEYVACIRRTHDGLGYWIPSGGGIIQNFGNAPHLGNAPRYPKEQWVYGLCWDMLPYSLSDHGYAVQYADGNLAIFGDFEYFESIGAGEGQLRSPGNYKDYSDIVRDLALWAGFYLHKNPQPGTEMPEVYGNIEQTGAFAKECLPADMFDKKTVADCIKVLREIVGYLSWVDEEGGFRFESPNWWQMGNFLIDGTPYDRMPAIDERQHLTDYSMNFSDRNARSEIVVATQNPYPMATGGASPQGILTTRQVPPSASDLKGIVKPAMWTNGVFTEQKQQQVMVDLIAMHIWFARRISNVQCVANPLISINDQVRVYERQTGEVYIHYVRGRTINHDLISGEFTMSLTTHWMGGSPYNQVPMFYAGTTRPQGDGYWQVDSNGSVYAYGAAELYPENIADSHLDWVVAMGSTLSGLGYYTLDVSGKVITYGDAEHFGDLARFENDAKDFALTPSGEGYWILLSTGEVYAFGDAASMGPFDISGENNDGSPVYAVSFDVHPDGGGWCLLSNGEILLAGAVPDYGALFDDYPYNTAERPTRLRAMADGSGFWCTSNGGYVQAFGDAVWAGEADHEVEQTAFTAVWDIIVDPDAGENGYALQHADGKLDGFQDFEYHGAVGGEGVPRKAINWPIVSETVYNTLDPDLQQIALPVSADLAHFLQRTGSPSANNAVANNFGQENEPTLKALVS